jgi:adenylate cyclase
LENRPSRKLAVILHADVVGSTALVRLSETLAHHRIQDAFRRFSEAIDQYRGIAHEIRGDALVAEFGRASDAVSASVAFQAANAAHNEELTDEIRPAVRIGIAMGEVVVGDNTVTGEGVVLAQRVEQLAEPGRVCITGAIHEALPWRMPFDKDDLGEQKVKGFEEPVRIYVVSLKSGVEVPEPEECVQSMAATKPELPDKPSIAVLPFTNMSDDPEQEYFADGMSEDIITELSKFRSLFVIARNSSFAFKGQSVEVKNVSRKLGVRYVVEGSVRRAGTRVRINAQLIDAIEDSHIWAERYDRDLDDIFAVQDEVTEAIVTAIEATSY